MKPLSKSIELDEMSLGTAMNPLRVKLLQRRDRRRRPAGRRFALEGLEPRHLPSLTLPGLVAATNPADGATPLQAPQSFTITFDQATVDQVAAQWADALSVPPDQVLPALVALGTGQDVEIDRIAADGTATPVRGDNSAAPVSETITTTTATDGSTETQLVITLPAGRPVLGPGTYQIDLEPATQSALAAAFASVPTDAAWASTLNSATQPVPVAEFTVLGQGPTLVEASNLGPIGASTSSVQGYIDPADYRSAVSLYRFSVPAGPLRQFDAAVLTRAIGSPVETTLTLFDSAGYVLATRINAAGSASDPVGPALFTGLGQGTYYLGVSAAGNNPNFAYGYDPVTGRPGTAGVDEPAGAFVLDVSAPPAVASTELVGFSLDHADSLESSPTGLELTFSGPVDVSSLTQPDIQETALTVVDASGGSWPITALDYQASNDQLSLVFNEALPPGSYSLIVPSPGGLTDLAGRPVVGPAGDPSGVLARWDVSAFEGPTDQRGLGVLWPGTANVTWGTSATGTTSLAVGQEADDRFVALVAGFYELETQPGSGSAEIQVADGVHGGDPTTVDLARTNDYVVYLTPGVYYLRITSEGSQPAEFQWSLRAPEVDWELIGSNGVGQSPAATLDLIPVTPSGSGVGWTIESTGRFVNPAVPTADASTSAGVSPVAAAGSPSATTTTAAAAGPAATTASSGPAATTASSGPAAATASPVSGALLVSLETGPIGSPASGSGHASAVGPLADGASVALADAGTGLMPGIRYRSSLSGTEPRAGEGDPTSARDGASPAVLARSPSSPDDGAAGPPAASARADAAALAQAQSDPLVRLAGWFAGRLPGPSAEPGETDLPASELGTTLLASAASVDGTSDADAFGPARQRHHQPLSQADLGAPCALLVATALTYRLSDRVRRWWRRYHTAHALWPRPYAFGRGAAMPGDEA
jgi:hypothetical protein